MLSLTGFSTSLHFSVLSMQYSPVHVEASMVSLMTSTLASLVDQTTPSTALDVLHHQHTEGGSGHSGTVFVTPAKECTQMGNVAA